MGCGACGSCFNSYSVSSPIDRPPSVATVLSNLINKYTQQSSFQSANKQQTSQVQIEQHQKQQQQMIKFKKVHPVLSLQQCKLINNMIASTNGELPQVLSFIQAKMPTMNKQQLPGDPPIAMTLLNQNERIIWKCLLLIPEHINPTPFNDYPLPDFKHSISNSQQKVQMSFHQISLDVNRTFPGNKNIDRDSLTILLKNIVNCFQGVGYTQGMNFYAGFLLLCGFTPEQAYYLFIAIFITPDFFFVHNFNNEFKLVMTCNQILNESLPLKLSSHMNEMGISEQIYCFAWFLCSYLYTLSVQSCVIIWDHMIKTASCGQQGGGLPTIINIAILIMEKLQKQILKSTSPQNMLIILRGQNLSQTFDYQQMSKLIQQLKHRSSKYLMHGQKYIDRMKEKGKFRKCFITKRQFMEYDKQLKKTLTTKEGYQKYMKEIFGLTRVTPGKTHAEEELEHVGNPNIIHVKQHIDEIQKTK